MNWHLYFDQLKDWKKLPAYKAEPRIDGLVGHYLPEFLGSVVGEKIQGVVPEFPLHISTLRPDIPSNQSWKVDFLLIGETHNWLVEFKTDSGSRREAQDEYLAAAKRMGTDAILDGIRKIEKATMSRYRHKYAHLLAKLRSFGLVDQENAWTGKNPQLEIVYVQPHRTSSIVSENVVDFCQIAEWLECVHPDAEFEKAFADALRGWAGD